MGSSGLVLCTSKSSQDSSAADVDFCRIFCQTMLFEARGLVDLCNYMLSRTYMLLQAERNHRLACTQLHMTATVCTLRTPTRIHCL